MGFFDELLSKLINQSESRGRISSEDADRMRNRHSDIMSERESEESRKCVRCGRRDSFLIYRDDEWRCDESCD